MAGLIALLRDLHRVHRQARDFRELLDRLPQQLKIQRTKTARHEETFRQAQDKLKRLKVTSHEKEVTLKSKTEQIEKYETQINLASSKKEYDALKSEIAHTRQQCAALEDEILATLTEIDERAAALPQLEKNAQSAREELARFEETAKEQQVSLTAELDRVLAEIKELEGHLPEEHLPVYTRVIHAMGADGLSPVKDRTCSACGTEITEQHHHNLKLDRLLVCRSCGRILYLPE